MMARVVRKLRADAAEVLMRMADRLSPADVAVPSMYTEAPPAGRVVQAATEPRPYTPPRPDMKGGVITAEPQFLSDLRKIEEKKTP